MTSETIRHSTQGPERGEMARQQDKVAQTVCGEICELRIYLKQTRGDGGKFIYFSFEWSVFLDELTRQAIKSYFKTRQIISEINLWPLNIKSLFDSFTKKDEMLFFFPWLSAGLKAFSLVREALRISIIKKLLVQAIWRLKVDEKCMCVMFTMKCDFLSVAVILCFFHLAFIFFFFLLFPKWETIGMKNWWPLPLCTTLSNALWDLAHCQ